MRPGQTHIETVRDLETIPPGGVIRHVSDLNGLEVAVHLGNDLWAVTGSLASIAPPDWVGAEILIPKAVAVEAARLADVALSGIQHTIKGNTA